MYSMKYRKPRQWFYRSLDLSAHQYVPERDKMVFTLDGGGLFELAEASKCDIKISKHSMSELDKMRAKANDNVSRAQGPDHE